MINFLRPLCVILFATVIAACGNGNGDSASSRLASAGEDKVNRLCRKNAVHCGFAVGPVPGMKWGMPLKDARSYDLLPKERTSNGVQLYIVQSRSKKSEGVLEIAGFGKKGLETYTTFHGAPGDIGPYYCSSRKNIILFMKKMEEVWTKEMGEPYSRLANKKWGEVKYRLLGGAEFHITLTCTNPNTPTYGIFMTKGK